jgi:serine/threonine-protein kinase
MPGDSDQSRQPWSYQNLPTEVWDRLQQVLERFEDAWRRGERPNLEDYLPEGGAHRRVFVIELVHEDLEYRLTAGEAVRVETYLGRYPELRDDPGAALSLIAAEYDQRRQRQEGCAPEEYRQRFPQYGTELVSRLQACGARHDASAPVPEAAPDDLTPVGESPPETVHELPRVTVTAKGRSGWPTVPGYEIVGELGQGGMGEVYKARHLALQRLVALKLLRAGLRGQSELEGRFLEEAQLTGQLQHPGIPPVHEIGFLADGRPFLAMKLIQGRTLADLLQERSGPAADLPRFLAIFEQVCQTLAYAHARGVIHRDLKPANIMVGAFGEVQVMDWGLAKVLSAGRPAPAGRAADTDPLVTVRTASAGLSSQVGALLGTPAYMAPEQARGEVDQLDERCDVFGLGAMLCELLTGQPPYRGGLGEVLLQAERGELADAVAGLDASGADAPLVQLARACLAAPKEDRPRHAGEVSQALGAYLAGVQERLRQAELERAQAQVRAAEERKRRRLAVGLAAAVLGIIMIAAGGGLWLQWQQAENRHAVESAMDKAAVEQRQGHWKEAGAILEQVRARLGASGPADLRERVEQSLANLKLVDRLDAIRLGRATIVEGKFDSRTADPDYAAAFRESGLGVDGDDEGTVAGRILASPIRAQLVAALDDWAAATKSPQRQAWLLGVARRADPDGWRDRFREARVWQDRAALEHLADELLRDKLKMKVQSPQLLAALGTALFGRKCDAVPLLREARRHYPGDFWLNFELANALHQARQWEEAAGYFRAALALRPEVAVVYNNLGNVLFARPLSRCAAGQL